MNEAGGGYPGSAEDEAGAIIAQAENELLAWIIAGRGET